MTLGESRRGGGVCRSVTRRVPISLVLVCLALVPGLVRADMEGDVAYVDDLDDEAPSYPHRRRSDRVVAGWDADGAPAAYALRGRWLVRVATAEEREDADGNPVHRPPLPPGVEDDYSTDTHLVEGALGGGRAAVAVVSDRIDAENGMVDGRLVRLFAGRRPVAVIGDEASRFGTEVRAAGDVDGDGLEDLLVTAPSACDCCDCSGFTDDVHVYLATESRDPRGRFVRAMTIRGGDGMQNWIRALGVGDVDRDGRDDVVIVHGAEVRLHRGRPGGIEPEGRLIHRRREHSDGFGVDRLPGRRVGLFWIDFDEGVAGIATRRGRSLRTAPLALPRASE